MKQALLEMDGTIINGSGPTFGDYMAKRFAFLPTKEEEFLLKNFIFYLDQRQFLYVWIWKKDNI